jgi:hypothetical protein
VSLLAVLPGPWPVSMTAPGPARAGRRGPGKGGSNDLDPASRRRRSTRERCPRRPLGPAAVSRPGGMSVPAPDGTIRMSARAPRPASCRGKARSGQRRPASGGVKSWLRFARDNASRHRGPGRPHPGAGGRSFHAIAIPATVNGETHPVDLAPHGGTRPVIQCSNVHRQSRHQSASVRSGWHSRQVEQSPAPME